MNKGKIKQVIGAVVDVSFEDKLPGIYNALETELPSKEKLILEVQQHLGSNMVRTVAMGTTDGLKREQEVIDTEAAISVPVGEATLGRMVNVLGEPLDEGKPIESKKVYPIHRPAPEFKDQSTKAEIFSNG